MLAAMVNGQTDPLVLAEMAKGRMRRKIPDLAPSVGRGLSMSTTPSSHGRFWIGSSWVEHALSEIAMAIEAACAPWAEQLQLLQTIHLVGPTGRWCEQ